eukprot:1096404-Amphidinium_carterae.1
MNHEADTLNLRSARLTPWDKPGVSRRRGKNPLAKALMQRQATEPARNVNNWNSAPEHNEEPACE